MSKGLEALSIIKENHLQLAKEKYHKLEPKMLEDVLTRKAKRYDIIEKELKALDVLDSLFDFSTALRFPDNQLMLMIINKRTNEYWEIPLTQEQYESMKEALE